MLKRLAVLALLVGAVLVPSCRGDADAESAALPWTRVELVRVGEAPERTPVEVVTVRASDDAPWKAIRGGEEERIDVGGTAAGRFSAEGPRVLQIPLAIEANAIDLAEVDLHVPAGEEELVRLSFRKGDRARSYTPIDTVRGADGIQTVTFDMRSMRPLEGSLDSMLVHIAGQSSSVALARVHLARRPTTMLLPSPESGAALVAIDADTRRGVGIGPGEVFEGAVAKSGLIEFSYRTGTRDECGSAQLLVTVGNGTALCPLAAEDGPGWRRVTIAGARGDVLRARVEFGDDTRGFDPFTVIADVGWSVDRDLGESVVIDTDADPIVAVDPPPTVIVITSDTHRADQIGLLDGTDVRTPHIDALAKRGILFEDAVATSNSTNPSHVALFTGIHPRDTRVVTNNSPIAESVVTLAERFRDAGWRTAAAVSVVHLGDDMSGLGQGFDRFDAPPFPTGERVDATVGSEDSVRLGGETVDAAMRHMRDAAGQPLFLWVHVYDAHVPYLPPADFDRRYYGGSRDPREGPGLAVPEDRLHGTFRGIRDPEFPWAQYRALVDYVDVVLGEVLEHPRAKNGIIAFTADHGETFGNHGTWWDHLGIYRDNTHVPLILAWPGAPVARVAEPVEQMHVGRTLLELAGLEVDGFPGRDLRDAISDDWSPEPRFSISGQGLAVSLDDGRWVCVLHMAAETSNDGTVEWRRGQIELFDRASDPECVRDVVDANVDRAAKMRRVLLSWLADAAPPGMADEFYVTPAAAEALARLGYAAGTAPTSDWYEPGDDDDFENRYGR